MLQRRLNLGIVAHVDAGKTTLTERLLHAAGVIGDVGSVDKGTTQTDSLPLEQQRGITIRSAVVSFAIDDVTVNLIDTPGHPDFIAEVERVLGVLDGAILIVSAVEGVQAQTSVLMRALQRLRIPTLVFVNKIDRLGADCARTLTDIAERLTPAVVPMTSVEGEGSKAAVARAFADEEEGFRSRLVELVADHDDRLLTAYVHDETGISAQVLRQALAEQTAQALVHPVFCGAAITGAGVDGVMSGIAGLLPAAAGDPDGPVSAAVFKIDRGRAGEKIAYARMFSGTIRTRDRVQVAGGDDAKVTAIAVFDRGGATQQPAVRAGEIATLQGLADVRVGDTLGDVHPRVSRREFQPPTLESVVVPVDPADGRRLRVALGRLAEQDPLIDVRQDDRRNELSVSLYGEVQKEVVEATLATDFGIAVTFRETTPIYIERPTGVGEAVEVLRAEGNPFLATIGLRVEPASAGDGVDVRLDVDPRTIPLYIYKTAESFRTHLAEYVRDALAEGLFGWNVTDCVVTMFRCGYSVPDGPPSRRGPLSTAADFRKLTPIVVMQALEHARVAVCEPTVRATIEAPLDTVGALLPALARLGAVAEPPLLQSKLGTIDAVLPAARADELQRQLPALTRGEGVLDSSFAGYQPVGAERPTRPRMTPDPRNRGEYVRVAGRTIV
ncbi:MAG: GTP-binding protein [Gaiellaceae bacterium]